MGSLASASAFNAARRLARRPSSTPNSAPIRPKNLGTPSSTGSVPLKKSKPLKISLGLSHHRAHSRKKLRKSRDETIPIRHLYEGQAVCVDRASYGDQVIPLQDECCQVPGF